jgi:undecaprenyl phosphate-alpha-L-ara4N flippase subunit ArnF
MNDRRESWQGMFLVAWSIVLSASAQLLMKAGMLEFKSIAAFVNPMRAVQEISPLIHALTWVVAGLLLYIASLIFWVTALARYELSLAYPLLSLSYVLVYIGAIVWPRLNETISFPKTIGIALILCGVILVTRRKT